MFSLRRSTALALTAGAIGLVAVAAASTGSPSNVQPADYHYAPAPVAQASGGDAGPLPYPSIVNVHLVRAEAALSRAVTWSDQGQPGNAIGELSTARAQTQTAWIAAKYVIETAPPPVAGDGAYAHASGGAVGGVAYASPEETGAAVLNLQHDIVTTAIGLIDTPDPTLLPNLRTTIKSAITARDDAIGYIHAIPAPPVAGDGAVHAQAGGAPIAAGWSTVMPNVIPLLDDEIQEIKGTRAIYSTLSTSVRSFLGSMRLRLIDTEDTINQYWPPLPADG
jgi:hypothetical protein